MIDPVSTLLQLFLQVLVDGVEVLLINLRHGNLGPLVFRRSCRGMFAIENRFRS